MRNITGLRPFTLVETATGEFTAPDGARLTLTDTTADLTVLSWRPCVIPSGRYTLQHVRRPGPGPVEDFWIALDDSRNGLYQHVTTSTGHDGRPPAITVRPAQLPAPAAGGCASENDLRASLGDPGVLANRTAEYEQRWNAARTAHDRALMAARTATGHQGPDGAAAGYGPADDTGWTRDAYDAACLAAEVAALADAEIDAAAFQLRTTEFWLQDYSVTEVLMTRLAAKRLTSIRAAHAARDIDALCAAEAACGLGPYDRADYLTACAAAGLAALTDEQAEALADAYLHATRPAGGGNIVTYSAPGYGATEATLAMRRLGGIQAERRR